MSKKRLLAVNVFSYPQPGYRWILPHIADPDIEWQNYHLLIGDEPRPHSGLSACARAVLAVRRYRGEAVLITHGPEATRRCAVLCQAALFHPRHIAFSFHFARPPSRSARVMQRSCDHMIERYVTYSALEADVSSQRFRIPRSKIEATHWPYEPDDISDDSPLQSRNYACAVGGSDRDYATLAEAMRLVPDIRLVLVAKPDNLEGLRLPDNVDVRTLIPKHEAWSLMAHARVSILPVQSERSHCGHSCLVQAMYYGTPVLATASAGLDGYIADGATARTCRARDPGALAAGLRELWDDHREAERLGAAGQAYARAELSPERAAEKVVRWLRDGASPGTSPVA